MCGYACVGCGRCGKKRTLVTTIVCFKCNTENESGAITCKSCGYRFAPGYAPVSSQDKETKAG